MPRVGGFSLQGGLGRSLPSQRVLRWEGPNRESSGTQPEALRWSPGTAEAVERGPGLRTSKRGRGCYWSVREAPGRFGVKSAGFARGRHGAEREEEDRAQRAGHTADIQQAFVR